RLLCTGDVPHDLRSAYDPSRGVADWRPRDRDVHGSPAAGAPHGFELLDSLSFLDSFQHDRRVILHSGNLNRGNWLPDHFLGGVPKDPFGAAFPTRHQAG